MTALNVLAKLKSLNIQLYLRIFVKENVLTFKKTKDNILVVIINVLMWLLLSIQLINCWINN